MKTLNRKQELMLANVLLCAMVIFIHCASHPINNFIKNSTAYMLIFIPWRLSAFVVQGFVFLSAVKYFLKPIDDFNYKAFLVKRLKTVFLPYVLIVLIYYGYFIYNDYFSFSFTQLMYYIATGSLVSPFYFVVAILQFYLLMPLWRKMVNHMQPAPAITAALIIMLAAKYLIPILLAPSKFAGFNDRIFTTYIFYWVCGCYIGKNYGSVLSKINRYFLPSAAFFIAASVCNLFFSYRSFALGIEVPFLETLHTLYCICAVTLLFLLCCKLNKVKIPFLKQLDGVSYNVYLLHCLIIFAANDYFAQHGIYSVTKQFILRTSAAYIITFTICLLYKYIKTKLLFKNR